MATTITTYYPPSSPTLTSAIGSIKATTDQRKVLVQVIRDPDDAHVHIYDTWLYAFNGQVELTGLGRLIEASFRQAGLICQKVTVDIDGAPLDLMALYCEWALSDFNYRSSFWAAASSSVCHPGSAFRLGHWPDGSHDYQIKAMGLDSSGRPAMVDRTITKELDSSGSAPFLVDELVSAATTPDGSGNALATVIMVSVHHGDRQKIIYVAPSTSDFLTFEYRNIFNVFDLVDVVCTVNRKTDVDRDIAVVGGQAQHYNRVVSRTYEVTTAPLSHDQLRELEQLIASHSVRLWAGTSVYPVLITDHTCEYSTDDDSVTTVKFTFRFADQRPLLQGDEMAALRPSPSSIFNSAYSDQFA